MRILALRRGRKWTYDPEGEMILQGGDLLVLRGTEDGFHRLGAYARGEEAWPEEGG